jgi:phytoene dehydrogenase-like protein
MMILSTLLVCLFAGFAARSSTEDAGSQVVEREVCVIGGGSAGTYAAVRLQQLGKTVAVVERQDPLGGHVHTYQSAQTGETFEYGVVVYGKISVAKDYFDALGASYSEWTSFQVNEKILAADFSKSTKFQTKTLSRTSRHKRGATSDC